MSLENPATTDGLSSTLAALIRCLNIAGVGTTYQEYDYLSDGITTEGVDNDHADGDGGPLGGDSRTGFEKGPINVKVPLVSMKLPKPGHILECDFGEGAGFEYYRVTTSQGRSRTRNQVKTGAIPTTRLYHPFPLECLSEAHGQRATKSQAAGALAGSFTTALTAKNTRTGSTLAWSLGVMPGYTAPSWLSINASTGALSGTAVAGTWEILIIITETLTGSRPRKGFGILGLTIT